MPCDPVKKSFTQKIVFVVAIICYLAAIACAFAAFLHESADPNDPIRASLMAAVVFFVGCGVVLHVIATARLGGVLSGSGDIEGD
jgi:drug/metabolite transporter (DMT)-like permease